MMRLSGAQGNSLQNVRCAFMDFDRSPAGSNASTAESNTQRFAVEVKVRLAEITGT
jgi:hypothetical protein